MTAGGGSLPSRVLDALIRFSTANPFVHAALVGDGHLIDPVWVVERAPLTRYERHGWAFRVSATEAQKRLAVQWAEQRVGSRYGVLEILADAARFDLHIVLPSWYLWRPKRWTCSGFVVAAYGSAGTTLSFAPVPSPADLAYSPFLTGRRPWLGCARHGRSRAG